MSENQQNMASSSSAIVNGYLVNMLEFGDMNIVYLSLPNLPSTYFS